MQEPPQQKTSQIPAFRLRLADQMADYRRRLAEKVKHEREIQSLSRESLANRSGVSAKTIKRIEDQRVDNPRPVTIRRIAEALEVTPDRLRPPEELETDQLDRIEAKLNALLAASGTPVGDERVDRTVAKVRDVAAGRKSEPDSRSKPQSRQRSAKGRPAKRKTAASG